MDSFHTLRHFSLPDCPSLHQQLYASHSSTPTTITVIIFLIFLLLVRATAIFPRVR